MNMNFGISSKDFDKSKKEKSEDSSDQDEEELTFSEMESLTGGGREDDLFGVANDYTNRNAREFNSSDDDEDELYRTKIPWDLKFAYSLTSVSYTHLTLPTKRIV